MAKVPGHVAGWRRQVTQPPFIAGPLGSKARYIVSSVSNDNFFYRDYFVNQLNASDPNSKKTKIFT